MLLRYRSLVKQFYEPSNYIVIQIDARQIVGFDVSEIGSYDSSNILIDQHAILHEILAMSGCGTILLFLKAWKKPDPKITGTSIRFASIRIIVPNPHYQQSSD